MIKNNVYLKQNVLVEPLFNQWYAWPYLIPPATAAMYIANSHLKIMQSFVANPQIHISALKNPAMRGGPFINYEADKVGEIRMLMEDTARKQAHLLEFAAAVKTLEEKLMMKADGYSLEGFYQEIPDVLKGYVELVYDLQNRPSIRFIEGLLYKSKYYNSTSQSYLLSEMFNDDRPFIFSTPQLRSNGHLYLDLPFNDERMDELFKTERIPQPYETLKEMLCIGKESEEQFSTLFTTEEPAPTLRYEGNETRIRYFGHACLLIETKDVSVMCDPVVSYQYEGASNRFTYHDLPESIDYVILTHTHQDHVMLESLLRLRHKIKNLIVPKSSGADRTDPSLKLILQNVGFKNVEDLEEMEAIEIPGGMIMGLPFLGEHADLNIRTKLAYRVSFNGRSLLFAADSNNIEPKLYEHVHQLLGDVDILFLGMECDGAPLSWLYGPLLTKPLARVNDQSRRFDGSDYRKAVELVNCLKPSQVYIYAMGQEPWCSFLTSIKYTDESRPIVESNHLVEECKRRGIIAERLYGQKELFLA